MNAYELGIDLERAEWNAIDALKEWRRLARLIPRDIPERGALIRNLSLVILGLEGEPEWKPGDDNNTECPLCGGPLNDGERLFHSECAAAEQAAADGWGEDPRDTSVDVVRLGVRA